MILQLDAAPAHAVPRHDAAHRRRRPATGTPRARVAAPHVGVAAVPRTPATVPRTPATVPLATVAAAAPAGLPVPAGRELAVPVTR
jgi:hypothetical protein